jgi:hypothetical protein
VFIVIVQHGRDDARRAIGRGGDDAAAGGVLFVHPHRERVDPNHRGQWIAADDVVSTLEQFAVELRRTATNAWRIARDSPLARLWTGSDIRNKTSRNAGQDLSQCNRSAIFMEFALENCILNRE